MKALVHGGGTGALLLVQPPCFDPRSTHVSAAAQCIVQCGVCSVQCSRTRLTGLGHFHFLAKQQMHLNTAADDGDDYNHGNKMAKIICEYCS